MTIETKLEVISPSQAKKHLAAWGGNRKVSKLLVERYADAMRKGQWQAQNGETIKISKDGKLLDGQHRMHAVVESNKSIQFLVVRDVPFEAFVTIDSGKARSAGDVASIAGIANSSSVTSMARLMIQIEVLGYISEDSRLRPSKQEILAYCREHDAVMQESYRATIRSKCTMLMGVTIPAAMHAMASMRGLGSYATQFFTEMGTGVFSIDNIEAYPVYMLRQRLIKMQASRTRFPPPVLMAYLIKTWNAFIQNKKAQIVRFTEAEDFPTMIFKPK